MPDVKRLEVGPIRDPNDIEKAVRQIVQKINEMIVELNKLIP